MRNLKKITREYFVFSKKERNVAVYLSATILFITVLPGFQNQLFPPKHNFNYETIAPLLVAVSVPDVEEPQTYSNQNYRPEKNGSSHFVYQKWEENNDNDFAEIQLFQFDPNTISAEQWMLLGVNKMIAERIVNYRIKGGKFKKKEDLLKTYGFKEEDYNRLQNYIVIDTAIFISDNNNNKSIGKTIIPVSPVLTNLNTAEKEQLMQLGFSADNAIRIIKFRGEAGGFYSLEQLYTLFGIDLEQVEIVKPYLFTDVSEITKININTISFEELEKHAYISEDLANGIITYRNTTGKFYSLNELMKVKGMYPSLFEKLKPYLKL